MLTKPLTGDSTGTALLKIQNDIAASMDSGKAVVPYGLGLMTLC